MNYIVFDLEWNCPYVSSKISKKAAKYPTEIIEFGAIKLDENMNELDRFSRFVRPRFYTKVQKHILSVTHIEQSDLEAGMPFPRAAEEFLTWCGDDPVFMSWGSSDIKELKRNMEYYKMSDIRLAHFIDVQILFCMMKNDKMQRSVSYAVETLDISQTLPFHRAVNDAWYTAEILKNFDFKKYMDIYNEDYFFVYTKNYKEEKDTEEGYNRFAKNDCKSLKSAYAYIKAFEVRCPKCDKKTTVCRKWKLNGRKINVALTQCADHGYIFAKAKVKSMEDDTLSIFFNISMATGDQLKVFQNKETEQ